MSYPKDSKCCKHDDSDCCDSCNPRKYKKISYVPFEITKHGKYNLCKNLVYNGTDAAITISASNVTLNFCHHNLELTQDGAIGILINGVNEVVIENDAIFATSRASVDTSAAIHVVNSRKVILKDILAKETSYGVLIDDSNDVILRRFHAQNNSYANLRVNNSTGIVMEDSHLENVVDDLAVAGIRFDNVNDIQILKTKLFNADIFCRIIDGLLIDNVISIMDDPNYSYGVLQIGSNTALDAEIIYAGNNVIVRNSTFSNRNSLDYGPAAFFGISGHNWLLENCNFECNRKNGSPSETAGVAIGGNPAFPNLFGSAPTINYVNGCRIVNCNVKGSSTFGIVVASNRDTNSLNKNVVFDNVNVNGATEAGVFLYINNNTTFEKCKIEHNGFGVLVIESNNNSFLNNSITTNAGPACLLDFISFENNIRGNNIFNNYGGLFDLGGSNQYENVIYNNSFLENHEFDIMAAARPKIRARVSGKQRGAKTV